MYEKLKNTLRTTNMLYVTEEKLEEDYHLMPFRLICEHIRLSDFEKGWEIYIALKPSIILFHALIDARIVIEFIKKIRHVNSKCSIMVLTSKELQTELSSALEGYIQKLLVHPVTYEELISSLANSIDYDNLYYYINNTIMFEPNKSSLLVGEVRINLTQKEAKLLILLLQNRHRIVTYSEIENFVWSDKSMSRNTLTSIVQNIRKKSGFNNVIKNYSNQGYQIAEL